MNCRICGNSEGNRTHVVREMMFGTGETFSYFQCANCGCLQIVEVPKDLSRYYPPDYCSFTPEVNRRFESRIRNLIRLPRYRYAVLHRGFLGRVLHAVSPKPGLDRLAPANLTEASRVLDVGCGSGKFLYTLRTIGMKNLLGVDPYVERDIEYNNGLRILRKSVFDVDGRWDLVMFRHSLEHMSKQVETMSAAARLLSDAGTCMVHIPIVSSWAWEHYGVNWVALDAPRHLYLHSLESLKLLIGKSGFRLAKVLYDSDDFQFWGSEQNAKGIPLKSEQSWSENPSKSIFSRADIRRFGKKAERLNRDGRGDTACFYLVRT